MKQLKILVPLGAALLGVLILISYFSFSKSHPSAESAIDDHALLQQAPTEIAANLVRGDNANVQVSADLPQSLRGTDVDGGFKVDEKGNLIVSLDNKRFFDYFLATVGEESISTIIARIRSTLEQKLQEPARSQALKVLEEYLSYKAGLAELEKQIGGNSPTETGESNLTVLKRRMEAIFNTRSQYLSQPVQEAFFGEDEAVDRYSLASLEVQADQSLSDSQRQEKLLALEEQLPEKVREQRQETMKYQRYTVEENKLKAQHASPEELYNFRSQKFGAEAAGRLAQLDQKHAQWNTKMGQYNVEKRRLKDAGLSESDYQTQLQSLRQQHFSEQEIRRVQALDSIAESGAN